MRKFYIETYGCQMNVADSEVVTSIMGQNDFEPTNNIHEADLILVNTCSIRENAEQRIWGRLDLFKSEKKKRPGMLVGVIGCMAERLKEKLLESDKMVDIVVGPDAYRQLPEMVGEALDGHKAVNVLLSREETYADISPVRMDSNGVSAFISIMRGCNNMCSYCVVPYVRGAERSRDPKTILREVEEILEAGYKEVTLLGQNVNSYRWTEDGPVTDFPELLRSVAKKSEHLRVRFATSHPKDLSDDLLKVMSEEKNICRHIHLPAQSGSSRMLTMMNRKYSREWYLERIAAIRKYLPDVSLSTDMIAGFCTETEEDHIETLTLMEEVGYDFAYMFKYSQRPGTKADRDLQDDVPEDVKTRRLSEIIALQNKLSAKGKRTDVGKEYEVLVEGRSKKSASDLQGRTSQNKVVVFPGNGSKPGDYVRVKIIRSTSATLIGEAIS